jgi:MoaA/NifB/PqqE/SkfB family radical SAM enzyme
MHVLVLFSPLRISRDFIDYPYFADLGALQAAACLRASGAGVQLVDALAMPGATLAADGSEVVLGAPQDRVTAAMSDAVASADLLVAQLSPFHRPPSASPSLSALLAAARARRPELPIVLADLYQSGQHYVRYDANELLKAYPDADALLLHEAEQSLASLAERLVGHGRPDAPLIVDGGEVDDLNALPLPAFDLVDVEAYFAFHERVVDGLGRAAWAFPIVGRALPLLSSRGCPFRCIHCSSNPGRSADAPKRQRRLSKEQLDVHLDALKQVGAHKVFVLDELANVSEAHFDHLLEAVDARGLDLEIPNGLRADYVLEKHLDVLTRRATTLSISAESGVQRVVDAVVDKSLDLSTIPKVCEQAKRRGLATLVHFMIGLPGETAEEINATLSFARSLKERFDAFPSVQFATPLPGTRLAQLSAPERRRLEVASDWGPRFQRVPSASAQCVTPDALRAFKETFDLWLSASGGPKKAILNVTYRCNNRCTFCAVGTRTQLDGNFERQRQLLIKYRKAGVSLLDLDGGEPTLNPKLFALIRFARHAGYEKVNVTTNGRMAAYDAYAKELCESGVTSILFSVHGHTAWLHAANVGVPEAFAQTLEGIANVQKHAKSQLALGANVTVTLSNHKHLMDIAELVHSLGLRWLNIQFLTPFGRATSTVAPDERAAAAETMRVLDAFEGRMKLAVINAPWCYFPGYERFVVGDMLKLERHMIFVDNEEVNLFEYLKSEREFREECTPCPRRVFCGGFYRTRDVAEPTWLIEPADLVRPVEKRGLTPPSKERSRAES